MIETMKIGVSLNMTGDAPAKLKLFHGNVERFDKLLKALNSNLKITSERIALLNPHMEAFVAHSNNAAGGLRNVSTAAGNSSRSLGGLNKRLSTSVGEMNKLNESAHRAHGTLNRLESTGRLGRPGGGGGGSGDVYHGRGGFHLRGAHLGPIGMTGPLAALVVGVHIGKKAFESNLNYEQMSGQLELQNIPGLSKPEINTFVQQNTSKYVGPTALMRALVDSASIAKNAGEAKALAPLMAKMRAYSEIHFGEGKFSHAEEQAAFKTAELGTGSMKAEKIGPFLERMFQLMVASGGRIMPSQWQQTFKYARGALSGSEQFHREISPDMLFLLEPLLQELGGSKVGTQIAQLQGRMKAGTMTHAGAKFITEHMPGLLKPGAAEFGPTGKFRRIKPGGMIGWEKQPLAWLQENFIPEFNKMPGKHGFNEFQLAASQIFKNTDLTLVMTFFAQFQKLMDMTKANKLTGGFGQAEMLAGDKPAAHVKELHESMDAFFVSVGSAWNPAIIAALDGLTKFFDGIPMLTNKLTDLMEWVHDSHPVASLVEGSKSVYSSVMQHAGQMLHGGVTPSVATTSGSKSTTMGKDVYVHLITNGYNIGKIAVNELSMALDTNAWVAKTNVSFAGSNSTPPGTQATTGF